MSFNHKPPEDMKENSQANQQQFSFDDCANIQIIG